MVRLAGEGRTILICSHQVAEIERIASHVAFLHAGRVLLTAPLENLRELLVRVRLRCEGARPNGAMLGTVLQEQRVGGKWQMILREPNRDALNRLRVAPGIHDYEEAPLGLEEIDRIPTAVGQPELRRLRSVERYAPARRRMHAPEIDDELVVDERPHVVVAREAEDCRGSAGQVGEGVMHLAGEREIMVSRRAALGVRLRIRPRVPSKSVQRK